MLEAGVKVLKLSAQGLPLSRISLEPAVRREEDFVLCNHRATDWAIQ